MATSSWSRVPTFSISLLALVLTVGTRSPTNRALAHKREALLCADSRDHDRPHAGADVGLVPVDRLAAKAHRIAALISRSMLYAVSVADEDLRRMDRV